MQTYAIFKKNISGKALTPEGADRIGCGEGVSPLHWTVRRHHWARGTPLGTGGTCPHFQKCPGTGPPLGSEQ